MAKQSTKLYWTKYLKCTRHELTDDGIEIEVEIDGSIDFSNTEIIREENEITELEDPDGFIVDMNGIKYRDYIKNPENYTVMSEILYKKSDLDAYN